MLLHSGLMLPILLTAVLCLLLNVLTLQARQVAPLIEDDWARRPHRAAGKSLLCILLIKPSSELYPDKDFKTQIEV